MKKQIKLSILVASMAFVAIGCGGGSDSDTPKAQVQPNPHKNQVPNKHVGEVKRKIQQQFNMPSAANVTGKVDNKEGLIISEDADNYYLTVKHNNIAKNVQFFIDNDNNSKTGKLLEGGAELLVENGQLYTNDENSTWVKYAGDSKNVSYNAGTTEDSVKLSKDYILDGNFGVRAQVLDAKWYPKISAPARFPKSYYNVEMTPYSDFLNSNISYTYVKSDDNVSTIKISDDQTNGNVDILFSSNEFAHYMKIFVDSDNDATTGYIPKNDDNTTLWKNMGANYLIEDAKLYSYDASATDWPWKYEQDIPYVIIEKDAKKHIAFNVKKSALLLSDNSGSIKLTAVTNNINWTKTQGLPEINATTELQSYDF